MSKWCHLKIIWNMIISGHLIVIICSSLTHSTPIIIYKNRFSFSRNKKYSLFFSHNFQNFLLLFSFFYKIFWTFSFLRLLPFHFSLFPLFPLPRLQLSVFFYYFSYSKVFLFFSVLFNFALVVFLFLLIVIVFTI